MMAEQDLDMLIASLNQEASNEVGMFFCENCGHTPYVNVKYSLNPSEPCTECGFNNWIFEPTGEDAEDEQR